MKYEKATGVPDPKRCMPGTKALYETILFFSPELAFNGCYVRRTVRTSKSVWSCHAEGRAFDLNRKMANGKPDPKPIPPNSPAHQKIWHWLAVLTWHHEALGIQRWIYKDQIWTVGVGQKTNSPNNSLTKLHQQHVHIEMTREKGMTLTPVEIRKTLFGK